MKDLAQRSATTLFVLGGAAVAFGLAACLWPGMTAITFALIWGCYALIDGIACLAAVFTGKRAGGRGLLIVSGVVSVVAGLVALLRPGIGVSSLVWVLGFWLVARGVAEIITAWKLPGSDRWLLVFVGALWVSAGIATMAMPGLAAITLAWLIGIMALVWGIGLIVAGFRAKQVAKTVA